MHSGSKGGGGQNEKKCITKKQLKTKSQKNTIY